MRRIIGIELRRSHAPTLAVLIIVVSAGALAAAGASWSGQWLRFGYDHASALFILAPLALAGGAMLGRGERRTRTEELHGSTARPRWQRVTPTAAALAIAVAVAHLLVFAAGTAIVATRATYLSAGPVLIPLADVTILAGAAVLGLAAGRAWPSPLVPPALAVVGLLVQVVAADRTPGTITRLDNLSLLAQPPTYDWDVTTGRAVLGHLVLGAGLALGGFVLAAAASWLPRVVAVAVLAAALVAAAVLPGTRMADRYRVDLAAQRLVCADGTPQVCVTAVHAATLESAAPQVRRALDLLGKLPGGPSRAVEWRAAGIYEPGSADADPPTVPAGPGTVAFDLGLDDAGHIAPDLTETIVYGAGTSRLGCEPADEVARAAAGAWLLGADDLNVSDLPGDDEEIHTQARETLRRLRTLPAAEQTRRVTALRDAALTCSTDLLPLLTGHPSS